MPKKPTDTLTWKKDNEHIIIERFLRETIYINKTTGKAEFKLTEVSEIPPTTHKRKPKHRHK